MLFTDVFSDPVIKENTDAASFLKDSSFVLL